MIKDKEIKMKLMEKLMEEMGDAEMGKFKKEDPEVMVKEVKADVMPMSDAKDMIKEKMMGMADKENYEDDDMDDEYMGEFYEKIKEKKRKMKEMA